MFFALPVPNSSHAERTVVRSGSSVGHPVREGGDDIHPVVALRLAVAHVVLETRVRTEGPLAVVVVPAEAIGSGGVPGVAKDEERRSVGGFQRVAVGGGTEEPTAKRIGLLLGFRPGNGFERTGFTVDPCVCRRRPAAPRPRPGDCRHHPDPEGLPTVPEPVDPLGETLALQIYPHGLFRVGVAGGARRGERKFLFFPDMDRSGGAWQPRGQ